MIPVSEGFMRCCREGGTRVSRVYTVDRDLTRRYQLPVAEGTLRVSGTDAVRRSLDCVVTSDDDDLVPRDEDSIVSVIGTEVLLESGWMVDGEPEVVPCGVFQLKSAEVQRGPGSLNISLGGLDRSCIVQRESPRPIATSPGATVAQVVRALVRAQYPDCEFDIDDAGEIRLSNLLFQAKSDLWSEAVKVAESAGLMIYFDSVGRCAMSSMYRDMNDVADMRYVDDIPVMGITRTVDTDNFYNGVVVFGTHSSNATIVGQAWIDDPRSPYRRNGKMGERPKIIESEKVSSILAANNMAKAELRKMVAFADSVEIEAVPNPSADVGDKFTSDDETSGTSGGYFTLGYEIDLSPTGLMSVHGGRVMEGISS